MRNSLIDIYRVGQLNNLRPDQSRDWVLNVSIDTIGQFPAGARIEYSISDIETRQVVSSGNLISINNTGVVISGTAVLDKASYKLWWPNGLGAQNLYNITVVVKSASGEAVASITKKTGFRTILLYMGEVTDEEIVNGTAPGGHCKT